MFNILIVDDEPLIREGIASDIEWPDLGCNAPLLAENGLEAVEIIKTNRIDIVISDIKMPGMNGLDLAKWINENYSRIKVIILTGYDDFNFAQSAIKFGVVDFILKPTKLEEIEDSIKKIKDKLVEEEQRYQLLEESEKAIKKNKIYERNQIINSLIFNRVENAGEIKLKMDNMDFNPVIQRVAVLELNDCPGISLKDSSSVIYYIEYIESFITDKTQDKQVQFLSQLENNQFVIFFYTECYDMDNISFCKLTEHIISDLENSISRFAPFDITVGLSYADKSIYNIKNLYFDALKKSDMIKAKKFYVENPNVQGNINIAEIIGPGYKDVLEQKDLSGINTEVDNLFCKLNNKPIVYLKSAAIEFINHTLLLINKDYVSRSICKERIYSMIINSMDVQEIVHIVKEALRKVYINMTVFQDDIESDGLDEKIVSYIRTNFFNDLTLESVAEKFYISSGHLSRLLKKACSKTFLDILTQVRIENAKILLKNPRLKAYEVGEMVGFKDPKYFSQVFKRYTGKTPSEFK